MRFEEHDPRQTGSADPLVKAVIFDFDGVILESADIKTNAFLDLFSMYPEHRQAIQRYHLDNLGVSRYLKFEWVYSELLQQPLEAVESERLGDAFSRIVLEKILNCAYVPGAVACLDTLRRHQNLFVASGTPQWELEFIIKKRALESFFLEIWGTPSTKVEIIQSILTRYNLEESEVLFIGDGVSDYRAAEESGVGFVARDNGTGDVDWRRFGLKPIRDLSAVPKMLGVCDQESRV